MVRTDEITVTPDDYPAGMPAERKLPLGERPIHEYLRHQADTRPDTVAVNFHGREITYADLDEATDVFATYLAERGYGAGDRVVVHLQNVPQYYVAYYGVLKSGAQVVPIQPMSKGHRLAYLLNDSGATLLVTHDVNADTIDDLWTETALDQVVYVRYETFLPDEPVPALHEEVLEALDHERDGTEGNAAYLDEILRSTRRDPPTLDVDLDDVCFLLYSSGTTGQPKGCLHTYRNGLLMSGSIATTFDFETLDPHVCFLPLCHTGGIFNTYPQMLFGNTTILISRYSPTILMSAIDAYEPEIGVFTSNAITEMLDHPDNESYDLSSMEYAPTASFGEPVDQRMADSWRELTGGELSEYAYGGVEVHGICNFTYKIDHPPEPIFVGLPMYGVDQVIRDFETHEPLDVGEAGEISIESPTLMEGYWNMAEETADSFYGDYYLSGDIGRMTEEGYLYFMGRRKYMIKYRGFSIAPAEVETILEQHPSIGMAGVVGVADEESGEIPMAFVETNDTDLDEETVIEWARERMASYKVPREVRLVDELPRTDVEKLDREALSEQVGE